MLNFYRLPDIDHPLYKTIKRMREIEQTRDKLAWEMRESQNQAMETLAKFRPGDKVKSNYSGQVYFIKAYRLSEVHPSGISYDLVMPRKDGGMPKIGKLMVRNVDQNLLTNV